MSKTRISLRGLFSNTKFVAVFSIIVAFVFWVIVALEYAPVVENVIENVPVTIKTDNSVPDKLGLQIFGTSDYTVDITVKGNRYIVGGNLLSANDFEVTAQTAYVNSAGSHNLPLKVTAKNADAEYEITGLSADYIEVFFDAYEEKELEVEPRIVSELENYTDNGYMFDKNDILLTHKKVTLTGAKTEIDRIESVFADIHIDDELTQSTTLDADVAFDAEDVSHVGIKEEASLKIPVTLPVYKVMTLPTSVSFKNAPASFLNNPPPYSVSPASVNVAVLQNGGNSEKKLEIGEIDFNNITTGTQKFTFRASDIKDVKVLDGTKDFSVSLEINGYFIKEMLLDENNIIVSGTNNQNLDIDYSDVGNITVIGKFEDISALESSSLSAKIDLKNVKLTSNPSKVKMTVYLKNSDNCWVYGEYFANIKA